jgi:cytochrome c oxidase subunit 2
MVDPTDMTRRRFSYTAFAAFAILGRPAAAHAAPSIVNVHASDFQFTPSTIQARVGEETVLRFTSDEDVHGISSSELGIPRTLIVPKMSVDIAFTPSKAGTYRLHCAYYCGSEHAGMLLTIQAEK